MSCDNLAVTGSANSRVVHPPSTAADQLATRLFALDEGSLTTREVTAQVAREITRWALARGWSVRAEARVRPPESSGHLERLGYIDLIIRRSPPDPDLAIEIDSTDKPWSLAKLRYVVAAGMDAIWVRWGDAAWAGVYDDIDVIQLPARRQTAPRPRAHDQLTLWPR